MMIGRAQTITSLIQKRMYGRVFGRSEDASSEDAPTSSMPSRPSSATTHKRRINPLYPMNTKSMQEIGQTVPESTAPESSSPQKNERAEPESALGSPDAMWLGGFLAKRETKGDGTNQSDSASETAAIPVTPSNVLVDLMVALIPIPGAGSVVPYFYMTMAVYILLRNGWITLAFALIWAYLDAAFYFFLRAWSIPVPWPVRPGVPKKNGPPVPPPPPHVVVAYDPLALQVVIINPLYALFGLLIGLFSVSVFDLDMVRDNCSLCWEVIVQTIILFIIVVHQGEYISWCLHTIGGPVYLLTGVALWNSSYSHFDRFAPILYLIIFAWFLSAIWMFSNFMIHMGRMSWRSGRVILWSVQGTYAWSIFFGVISYVFVASLYKFIEESS